MTNNTNQYLSKAYVEELIRNFMKNLFYRIEKDGECVYLMGSLHASSQHLKISSEAMSSFEKAENIIFEADVSNSLEAKERLEERCKVWMKENLSTQQINAEQMDKLAFIWNRNYFLFFISFILPNIPQKSMKEMVPLQAVNFAMLTLVRYLGFDKPGLDFLFMGRAIKLGKKLLYLEATAQQLDLVAGLFLTYEEQLEIINHSYADSSFEEANILSNLRSLEKAYLDENLDYFDKKAEEKLTTASPAVHKHHQMFITDRDYKMALGINDYIKQGYKNLFVVIGAAHLTGVIEHLNSLGYQITPIQQSEKKHYINTFYSRHSLNVNMLGVACSIGLLRLVIYQRNTNTNFGLLITFVALVSACKLTLEYAQERFSFRREGGLYSKKDTVTSALLEASEEEFISLKKSL